MMHVTAKMPQSHFDSDGSRKVVALSPATLNDKELLPTYILCPALAGEADCIPSQMHGNDPFIDDQYH